MLQAVILAGGLGTRIDLISKKLPKSLIEINGKPFLAWQLELFKENGITEVILCVSHRAELIENYLASKKNFGLKISLSFDGEQQLGTGGAVVKALPLLADNFMVIYGDSYLPVNFKMIQDFYMEQNKPALMTVLKNDFNIEMSNVIYNNNMIIKYDKAKFDPKMTYIDFGLSFYSKKAFDGYMPGVKTDLSEIQYSLSQLNRLAGYEVTQRYFEIGSWQGISDFEAYSKGLL